MERLEKSSAGVRVGLDLLLFEVAIVILNLGFGFRWCLPEPRASPLLDQNADRDYRERGVTLHVLTERKTGLGGLFRPRTRGHRSAECANLVQLLSHQQQADTQTRKNHGCDPVQGTVRAWRATEPGGQAVGQQGDDTENSPGNVDEN